MNHRLTTKVLKYLVFLLLLSGTFILTGSILDPDTYFIYPPFHSAIEALGAMAAIISMLHKEIDRSKNTGTVCPIPVLEELEKRIASLLTVHTMLSESSWQPLNLSELCQKIFDSVLKGTFPGDRVILEKTADPIRVSSNQAHALALVINEVATNFVKHARSKDQQPAIHMTLLEKKWPHLS